MLLCLLWGIHKSKRSPEQTFVALSPYYYYYYLLLLVLSICIRIAVFKN